MQNGRYAGRSFSMKQEPTGTRSGRNSERPITVISVRPPARQDAEIKVDTPRNAVFGNK
jgi:hypothetical protein